MSHPCTDSLFSDDYIGWKFIAYNIVTIFWLCISDLCKTFILKVNVVDQVNSCYGLNATVAQYFPICIVYTEYIFHFMAFSRFTLLFSHLVF